MATYEYDLDNWLISATRMIGTYTYDTLNVMDAFIDNLSVEMSFPNTRDWVKKTPLDKLLIHFEQDDISDPILGFGVPDELVIDDFDPVEPIAKLHEAARHQINFDVGVWASAEMGGSTKRMEAVQALKGMFATAGGRIAFNLATNLSVMSFDGGRNELDRINDVPVWRTVDMTLVIDVFSRHIPAVSEWVPTETILDDDLTIVTDGGIILPVETN